MKRWSSVDDEIPARAESEVSVLRALSIALVAVKVHTVYENKTNTYRLCDSYIGMGKCLRPIEARW